MLRCSKLLTGKIHDLNQWGVGVQYELCSISTVVIAVPCLVVVVVVLYQIIQLTYIFFYSLDFQVIAMND